MTAPRGGSGPRAPLVIAHLCTCSSGVLPGGQRDSLMRPHPEPASVHTAPPLTAGHHPSRPNPSGLPGLPFLQSLQPPPASRPRHLSDPGSLADEARGSPTRPLELAYAPVTYALTHGRGQRARRTGDASRAARAAGAAAGPHKGTDSCGQRPERRSESKTAESRPGSHPGGKRSEASPRPGRWRLPAPERPHARLCGLALAAGNERKPPRGPRAAEDPGARACSPGRPPCLASFTYSESVSLTQYLRVPSACPLGGS